jgi:hypothetical protein
MLEAAYYARRKLAELEEPRILEKARFMRELEALRPPRRPATMIFGDTLVSVGEWLARAGESIARPSGQAESGEW